MDIHERFALQDCPRCGGPGLLEEENGWCVYAVCMDCGASYPLRAVLEAEDIPRCPQCGGVIKPSVVLYGEAPDKYVCMGACREISNADTLIVAGTSLSVEPAASFLTYFSGKNLVVINREPTPADSRASLVIRDSVARVLGGC